jgi:hypothetical protein
MDTNLPVAESVSTTSRQRLRLRHLFAAVTGAAVLFAVLAALIRGSSAEVQFSAFGQSVVLVLMIVGCIGYAFHKRQQVELLAGPGVERFGRKAGRVLHWFLMGSFLGLLAMTPVAEWYKAKPGEIVNLLPSPWVLFMAVNYMVVRVWWKIDPMAIEAREHGLIQGGWQFVAWNDINRFTWSGKGGRQLNLFLKRLTVMHVQTDASFAGRLNELLEERTGPAARENARSA